MVYDSSNRSCRHQFLSLSIYSEEIDVEVNTYTPARADDTYNGGLGCEVLQFISITDIKTMYGASNLDKFGQFTNFS